MDEAVQAQAAALDPERGDEVAVPKEGIVVAAPTDDFSEEIDLAQRRGQREVDPALDRSARDASAVTASVRGGHGAAERVREVTDIMARGEEE